MPFQDSGQPSSPPNKRVCLGKIAGTHGVKGLVKILPFGEDPMLIFDIQPLYTSEDGDETLSLHYKNPQGKYFLAAIDGIHSKEEAEALKKPELWVERSALPALEDADEYYVEDLVGLKVITEDDENFGVIKAVPDYGAGELLEIRPRNGKTFLLPFRDEYVPEVDLQNGVVRIWEWKPFVLS